jgi:hypothetical protein
MSVKNKCIIYGDQFYLLSVVCAFREKFFVVKLFILLAELEVLLYWLSRLMSKAKRSCTDVTLSY